MAALVQGAAISRACLAATAPAKWRATAPSTGKAIARSAFFGNPKSVSQPTAAKKAEQKGRACMHVKAACRPGYVGVHRRMRPSWDRRRASRAAALTSPWAGYDCAPGVPFMSPWGRQSGCFQRGNSAGLNRFLEELMRELPRGMASRRGQCWNVKESKDGWVLRFELPGFGAEDVKVQVEDGDVLSIRAKLDESDEADQFRSRKGGNFQVQLRLPEIVRVDGITAELKKGILAVTLPKVVVEEQKPSVVRIQVNEASEAVTSNAKSEAVDVGGTPKEPSGTTSTEAGAGSESPQPPETPATPENEAQKENGGKAQ